MPPGPKATLDPIPHELLDERGEPRWGSYAGALGAIDLRPLASRATLFFRRKRWMWMGVATKDTFVAACVVDLGYAASAFAFVFHDGRMSFDSSAMGARARVGQTGEARFHRRSLSIEMTPSSLRVRARGLSIHAELGPSPAPAITAVAPIEGGGVNVTQKRALLSSRGAVSLGDRSIALDGLAAYDLTHGILARRTAWRWGFGLGLDASGVPIAFNIVQGFVGARECAVFHGSETRALGEGRFSFDEDPMRPWRVLSEEADLRFEPRGVHREEKDLLVVRSRFIQAVGTWRGTIAGTDVELLGVAEDQDVVW